MLFPRKSCQKKPLFHHRTIKLKVNLILGDPYNRYFDQTTLHFNIFTFFYIFICLTDLLAYAIVIFLCRSLCTKNSVICWFSFLWSTFLNFVECRTFILNSARISQDICKLEVEVALCPQVKCSFLCTDFHETHTSSLAFSGDLNQTSLKSVRKYKFYSHIKQSAFK